MLLWHGPPDIIRWDGNVRRPAMAHIVLRPSRISDFRFLEMTLRTKLAVVGTVLMAGTVAALCFRKSAVETQAASQSPTTLPLRDRDAAAAGVGASAAPQGVPLPAATNTSAVATVDVPLRTAPTGSEKSMLAPPQLPPAFNSDAVSSAAGANKVVERPTLPPPPLPDLRGNLREGPTLGPAQAVASTIPRPLERTTSVAERPANVADRPAGASERLAPWRSHTVVDGDTLSTLATRYLGSSGRFAEILEANRNTLRSADMLPIGTVLRIPPQSAPVTSQVSLPNEEPGLFPHLVPIPAGALTSRESSR